MRYIKSLALPLPFHALSYNAALRVESGTDRFHWTNITACVVLALRPVFTQRKRLQA